MQSGWTGVLLGCACVLLLGCGGSGGSSSSGGAPPAPNVLAITIDPASSICDIVNELCTQVTICQPNTATCQTVTDILVDTGSYGLRLFSSTLTVALVPETSGGAPIGECAFFGSLTTWGSVQIADVGLGGEPVVQVPVQVINPTFGGQYTATGRPAGNVCGVGLFRFDTQLYYACGATTCAPLAVPPAQQVQNPVALLPVDNNGVVITLPSVGAGGARLLTGSLILGIGTQSNNQPAGVTVFPAGVCAQFITTYKGTTFNDGGNCSNGGGFLDTGSNALFFPDSSIPVCSAFPFFYCPPSPLSLSATNTGATGAPSGVVNFQIASANALFASGNAVFNNLGGPASGFFDWGLPFFLGRTVYIGISGQNSVLGRGPFWAY